MFKRIRILLLSMFLLVVLTPFPGEGADHPSKQGQIKEPDGATKTRLIEDYGKLPLHFEANQGQTDGTVRFLSRGSRYGLFLTSTEAVLTLKRANQAPEKTGAETANPQTSILRMKWEGGNQDPKIEGVDELEGKSHYFLGNDPDQWRTNIPLYRKVTYRDLYPGIDLIYYGNQRQLEYDLVVTPKGDPDAIRLVIEGAEGVKVDEMGNLIIHAGGGEVIQQTPRIYQEVEGKKEFIKGGYVVDHSRENEDKDKVLIGFRMDKFDTEKPLIIDPALIYSTYLGGSGDDYVYGIAVDSSGSAYITGQTSSTNFPTASSIQGTFAGSSDVFVAKLNPAGSALVYSTYLGGSSADYAYGIAVDSSGSAYITGGTSSTNFPTVNPIEGTSGYGDAFVTKLSPDGSALIYSTYLGGSDGDYGLGIAVDSSGSAYITGSTWSTNFPTLNPIQGTYTGSGDVFVTKLSPDGSALIYSTYLGGSDIDVGYGIAVDSSGNAYITGSTYSTDFPTANPFQASNAGIAGNRDIFVTKLNPDGSALVYSTYLGGNGDDWGRGIAVDSSGSAYITGGTSSTNFPTASPFQGTFAGGFDAFVTKFSPDGSALIYSTYLGGSGGEVGQGIAVDSSGSAYITGGTGSTDFPIASPIQGPQARGGVGDAFVTKLSPAGSALICSTYLGGSGDDVGHGIAVDSSGNAYITGFTSSTNFPTVNPIQGTFAGGMGDVFVAKLDTEIISTPTIPTGPTSGITGISYLFQTGGSSSSLGHPVEYQFDWKGDGTDLSSWGSANQSKAWISSGTYSVKARARCTIVTSVMSDWSSGLSVVISAPETISIPSTLSGPTSGTVGTSYTYSTGGSTSSYGHSVQYLFDWGDSTNSGWLPVGTTSASKSWTSVATYSIKAQARCATDTSVVSSWSGVLSVTISAPETVSTPSILSGPASGTVENPYSYTTGGSTSSYGHTMEYQFDWKGDGSDLSPWGSSTQSKTWTQAGTYNVRARARCIIDTSVMSGWSGPIQVAIASSRSVRTLPHYYTPSLPVPVVITINPGAAVQTYSAEDSPPSGWAVSNINENGQWDDVNKKVKWGVFFDNNPRTLTYQVTPPVGQTGAKAFSGKASFDGVNEVTNGDSMIELGALLHPADTGLNFELSINEVTAYAAAWRLGQIWPVPPNPIPIEYPTNAGYLWRNGEAYHYDGTKIPPSCWVPGAATGSLSVKRSSRLKNQTSLKTPITLSTGTATRALPNCYTPSVAMSISIAVTPGQGTQVYAVEDSPPAGWTVSDINESGEWDSMKKKVKWGLYFDSNSRTLTYKVTPPSGEKETKTFSGTASFDGTNVTIGGDLTFGGCSTGPISLQSPSNNTYFDACSLYSLPTFSWTAEETFRTYEIDFSPDEGFSSTPVKVRVSGTATQTGITSNTLKRVLLLAGGSEGTVYWRVVGTRANRTTATSEVFSIIIDPSESVVTPTISPSSKVSLPALSWQNNCNIKFKVWFGSDDSFSKKSGYSFSVRDPNDNKGEFTKALTSGQWKAIRKLVGDTSGSPIYWHVESWDGLGRYDTTEVMSFILTD